MKTIDQLMEKLDAAAAEGKSSITVTTTKLDELIYQLEALLKQNPRGLED